MDFTDKAGSINELLAKPGNGQCSDCQKRLDLENAWGVLRYGVLVCQDCKLVHIALEHQRKQTLGAEDPGILSCAKSQVWTPDDFAKFLHNGNERTNQRLLSAFPVWVYQPTPNDSISLKEQWIQQKYRERSLEENELLKQPPKNAGTLCPVQFTRRAKSGQEPCAAVLHKKELYLTSEKRKEVINIVDVETALLTQDNGIMLAYRDQDSHGTDEFRFAHLNHDDQPVVLEWVNTLLYMKFMLLKEQNPNLPDQDLGKLLNRYVIRQSYVTAGSNPVDQLLFFVLSESRLAVFEHHLDEKPRYQTRIYSNHLTSVQYLTQVGNVLNIQVEKVYGYDEWLQALDQALHNERLNSLPERQVGLGVNVVDGGGSQFAESSLVTAFSSVHLSGPNSAHSPNSNTTQPHIHAPKHPNLQQIQHNQPSQVQPVQNNQQQVQQRLATQNQYPMPTQPSMQNNQILRGSQITNHHQPVNQRRSPPTTQSPQMVQEIPENQQNGKKEPKIHCYPAIGPMGEMGKVYRGELPPEHILPPRPKPGTIMPDQDPAAVFERPKIEPQQKLNCYPPIGPTGIPGQRPTGPPPMNSPMGPPMMPPKFPQSISHNPNHMTNDKSNDFPAEYQFGPAGDPTGYKDPMAQRRGSFQPPGPPPSRVDSWNAHPSMNSMPPPNIQPMRGGYDQNRRMGGNWGAPNVTRPNFDRSFSMPAGPDHGRNWRQPAPTPSPENDLWPSQPRQASVSSDHWGSDPDRSMAPPRDLWRPNRQGSATPEIWRQAEETIDHLIINGLVPASDMTTADINPNIKDHAQFCAEELYTAVRDHKYEMALSFLRGFRDVFSSSSDMEIRNLFVAQGELATLKNIILTRHRHIQGQHTREPPTLQPTNNPPPTGPWSTSREPISNLWSDPSTSNTERFPSPWSISQERGAGLHSISSRISPDSTSSTSEVSAPMPLWNQAPTQLSSRQGLDRHLSMNERASAFRPPNSQAQNPMVNRSISHSGVDSVFSSQSSLMERLGNRNTRISKPDIWATDNEPGDWNKTKRSSIKDNATLANIWQRERSPDPFNSDSLIFQNRIEDNLNQLVSTDTL